MWREPHTASQIRLAAALRYLESQGWKWALGMIGPSVPVDEEGDL